MLISQKQKPSQRIAPGVQFDKFLKIRSQKQSIIQSQHEPIHEKVQGFEQLLKLTKTGCTINPHSQQHKRHLNSQLHHTRPINHNKSQSSKTLNVLTGYNSSPGHENQQQQQNQRFLDDFVESDEAQLKKLNKMVFGITEWEEARGKQSLHGDRAVSCPKTSQEHKRPNTNLPRKQKTSQQALRSRKHQVYTACPANKKFRKFCSYLTKLQPSQHLTRINSQFLETSSKLNYPPALLNCNLLSENPNQFKELKQKIKVLEQKARNQYGLKFQQHTQKGEKRRNWEDDNSEEKENQELSFSDLELAPILAKEFPNRYKSYNQTIAEKQNPVNDASIPKSLIDIVQMKSETFHKNFTITNNNFINPQVVYKKGKMKKGFVYRPKTFKPAYTYLKI